MADCSKTEVFFEELDRMCKTVNKYGEAEDCVFYKPNYGCCGYMHWFPDGVEKAVTVLQKWSDEHPKKTRQSEFLKMFPNAVLIARDWLQYHSNTKDDCPVIDICPHKVDTTLEVDCKDVRSCYVCRKEYWQAEVE